MKRNEALPSNFLNKEDFPAPVLCQIAHVVMEDVKSQHGTERKPVLYIMGPNRPVDVTRGIILNGTNWDTLVEITGHEDSEHWEKCRIVVYHDPNVMFGGKKVGGIRVRKPKDAAAPTKPAAPEPPDDDVPPPDESESPF